MLKDLVNQIPTKWRSVILSYIENNLEIWNNLENEIQKQRIAMSKEISDDKMDLAFDRLKQQADLKLLELNQKFGG